MAIMMGHMAAGRHGMGQQLTATRNQGEHPGNGKNLWNPQKPRDTSLNKSTSPNPSRAVPPHGTMSPCEPVETVLIHTFQSPSRELTPQGSSMQPQTCLKC